jgi:hypothetical protein
MCMMPYSLWIGNSMQDALKNWYRLSRNQTYSYSWDRQLMLKVERGLADQYLAIQYSR